jgi:hypothetical protein
LEAALLKHLYLVGAVAALLATVALLPRLVEGGHHSSLLASILIDPSPRPVDRLQVGSSEETTAHK